MGPVIGKRCHLSRVVTIGLTVTEFQPPFVKTSKNLYKAQSNT